MSTDNLNFADESGGARAAAEEIARLRSNLHASAIAFAELEAKLKAAEDNLALSKGETEETERQAALYWDRLKAANERAERAETALVEMRMK